MSTPEPWERRPRETEPAWAAFQTYRDLGPGRRSTAEVARQSGKHKSLIDRWCKRWAWVARCREHDAARDQQLRQELAAAELATRLRHLKIGDVALNKVVERLAHLGPQDLPPSAVAHLIRSAAEIQRAALDLPAEAANTGYGQAILTAVDRAIAERQSSRD